MRTKIIKLNINKDDDDDELIKVPVNRGRGSLKMWKNCVLKDMREKGVTMEEAHETLIKVAT